MRDSDLFAVTNGACEIQLLEVRVSAAASGCFNRVPDSAPSGQAVETRVGHSTRDVDCQLNRMTACFTCCSPVGSSCNSARVASALLSS